MTFKKKEYMRLYREKNKDKINARNRECNKSDVRKEYMKKYRESNKEKQKQYDKIRDLNAPERHLIRDRKRRVLNNAPMVFYDFCQGPLCENKINHIRITQKYCSKLCCNRAYRNKQKEIKKT